MLTANRNLLSVGERELTMEGGESFGRDIVKGLMSGQKYLQSKYFYDKEGDRLFQQIMNCEEYYPFNCELEIFTQQAGTLADMIMKLQPEFDLIELGAGDCTKSIYLLRELVRRKANFNYMPIDISANIIDYLTTHLPSEIPGIKVKGLRGEYLDMLGYTAKCSNKRKVLLFLGSNLGNMLPEEAAVFCSQVRSHLQPGDLAIIGIDLKKNPSVIIAAYNDKDKFTREFNLNLLRRINRELKANFDLTKFDHFPIYDPSTGACRSFLISLADQLVSIATESGPVMISFRENEEIFMEISQKYTVGEMESLGENASFCTVNNIFDQKRWFMDTIWEAVQ